MGWESLINETDPQVCSNIIGSLVRNVGAVTTRFVTLIPVNVTRGTVTCVRIRGLIEVWFDATDLAVSLTNWPVMLSIQLVPVRNGAIEVNSILNTNNSADQESNRIMWQRQYYPTSGGTITGPGAVEFHSSNHAFVEVDVKVQRKFDRALWALILVAEIEADAESLHLMTAQLRALFKTGDGI